MSRFVAGRTGRRELKPGEEVVGVSMGSSSDQAAAWRKIGNRLRQASISGADVGTQDLLEDLPGLTYRCRCDRDRTVEYISSWCRELTGFLPADFESGRMTLASLIDPADRDMVGHAWQRAIGERGDFELFYRLHSATGEIRWVWDRGRGIGAGPGQAQHLEGFVLDVTELLEQRLLQFRVRRYEELARSIRRSVHDLNNLFTSMVGFLDLLIMSRREDAELGSQLMRIRGLTERAMEVNRRTREGAHQQNTGRMLLDVGEFLRKVTESVPSEGTAGEPVKLSRLPGSIAVDGDPMALEHALSNLIRNALESGTRGPVEIRCSSQGRDVRIEVRDTGRGIAPEQLHLIGVPFFSTKGQEGLGLTIAQAIILDHGGRLEFQSEPGLGSRFSVVLPVPPAESDEWDSLEALLR